jgi:hypothetical protein
MDTIREVLGAARAAASDPDTYAEGGAIAAFVTVAAIICGLFASMPT